MPLPGGPSDKGGNRYEAYWTINKLLDVLAGKYDSIRLEPPDPEDRGFEFSLSKCGTLQFHQAKRQQSSHGQWSLSNLASKGVLANFERKLQDEQTACVFVSTQDAPIIRELAERARDAQSSSEFQNFFLGSEPLQRGFGELRARWHEISEEELFKRIKKIYIEVISENTLRNFIENRTALTFDEDPSSAVSVLFDLVFSEVHQELTSSEIWSKLKERKLRPNSLNSNTAVLAAVDEQNERYIKLLKRGLISGLIIQRKEAQDIEISLSSANPLKTTMVTGSAGAGKSGILLQVAESLLSANVPLLAFRVDRLKPELTPDGVGRQLGLPSSPARILAALARGRPAVLLMDQLDAVSRVSGRDPQFFDCLLEILEQADTFPNVRVVLACRAFDLENDDRLRDLISDQNSGKERRVPHSSLKPLRRQSTRWGSTLLALPQSSSVC